MTARDGAGHGLEPFAYGTAVTTALAPDLAAQRLHSALEARGWRVLSDVALAEGLRVFGVLPPEADLTAALAVEEFLGVLLPFGMLVRTGDAGTTLAAVRVRELMRATNNGWLMEFAERADEALEAALAEAAG